MKKTILILLMIVSSAFIKFPHEIIGHWISNGPNNSKVNLDFNKDGTFKVMVDGDLENEGKYKFGNDTFFMYDNNCGMNVSGIYKIIFYSEDSASFSLINDSCAERAGEVNGGIITRVKE
jgi:hypothetical protein